MKSQEQISLENSINHQIIQSIRDHIMHSHQIMDAMIINQCLIDIANDKWRIDEIWYIDHLNDTIEKTLNWRTIEDVMTLWFERYQKICQLLFY